MASTEQRRKTGFACCPRLFFLTMLWVLPAVVNAQFAYTINNNTITITGYTGPGGAVTIPNKIIGLPVTGIGDYAFANSSSLTSVKIDHNVTSIAMGAFENCAVLTNVIIGHNVTSIGNSAFAGTSLISVTIPNSVTSMSHSVPLP